jgi:citrate lyase subunit beta/citryl-CoA lyase
MVGAIRAPLFVPATQPGRFAKAAASGADAVILDLEDAVAPADKNAARNALATGFTTLPVILRINAAGTPWHAADVTAARSLSPAAVMLPKAEDPQDVARVAAELPGIPIIALAETAAGLAHARAIAATDGVCRLAFGSVDFSADLDCAHTREVLLPARFELVLASRLAGIAPPLDGVTTQLKNPEAVYSDALHARELGMGGKLCIHPGQIPDAVRAFMPSAEETAWAEQVLAAGSGAISAGGEMVDEPVRAKARAILARAPAPR